MSTVTYPITVRRRLEKAEKRRWFSKAERGSADMLKPDAHHVLVYRVAGNYIQDSDRYGGSDERVVQATHVSMVDMRRNAPVVVRLEIPSQDAAAFEVFVTFTCTVIDPIAVVRDGVDAQQALWSHLKAHNKIFELGLGFPLSEVNKVRPVVSAQVKAYLTIRPPTVSGMEVTVASVEMSNPDVVAKFATTHRDRDYEVKLAELELKHQHRLATGRQFNDHDLANTQLDHDESVHTRKRNTSRREEFADTVHGHDLDSLTRHHAREIDGLQHQHDRDQEAASAAHQQILAGNRSAFARSEFAQDMEMIGQDPRRALIAAFAAGRIEAPELSDKLRQLDDQDRLAQIEQAQFEREHVLRIEADKRADDQAARGREERRKEREHTERMRQAEQNRTERVEKARDDRADRLLQEQRDRDDRIRREQADRLADQESREQQYSLLKILAANGQFNNSDMQSERMLAEFMNVPVPEVDSAEKPSLTTRASVATEGDDDDAHDDDQGLREEDV
ncbi:hypothetical protein QLQ12_06085 [Actinoplanes sp. NEAU-A12]|uniref:Band 7 domain-containing protein n=1 Tax=Actinoplanes sandaracinus TaxID=3045177 RepID=A0ABT6WEK7_9ACTN|nr:hypothetical protein [Actinoplanes sandaracinus]MDI6098171.1 hypothetical protein [Actinoplanes sandaracinus]